MNTTPMDLYKHLFGKNNETQFDLTENGQNCGFKSNTDMSVRSYISNEFNREIGFNPDTERIEIF